MKEIQRKINSTRNHVHRADLYRIRRHYDRRHSVGVGRFVSLPIFLSHHWTNFAKRPPWNITVGPYMFGFCTLLDLCVIIIALPVLLCVC